MSNGMQSPEQQSAASGVQAAGQQLLPPIVTLAARAGAGGYIIGPKVAERLGVTFLDRFITKSVAEHLNVPEDVVAAEEEKPRGGLSRLVAAFSLLAPPDGAPVEGVINDESRLRIEVEEFIVRASVHGGVILGRGANFVPRSRPNVLAVLLTGPREQRVQAVMRMENVDRRAAERAVDLHDEARLSYVRRMYGSEREDPADYHLIIDSTAIDWDTIVNLIVEASLARRQQAAMTVQQ
jgi:cytidylate kinase